MFCKSFLTFYQYNLLSYFQLIVLIKLITKFFRVVDVTQKEKSKPRPLALNTVELMKAASSGLG